MHAVYREVQAKTLLTSYKEQGDLFGTQYTVNLYRGCQHGCIYCDSRSACYQIHGFDTEVQVKVNAIDLLRKELGSKRSKGSVSLGGMNDPYGPVEGKYGLARQALEVLAEFKFPVHIITKSSLVVRDIDLLKEISKVYAAVSFTITAADDTVSKIIEPKAPPSSQRFAAMERLAAEGLYVGVTMHPILPFITDNTANIRSIAEKTARAGGKYILPYFGVTMREGNREYFYRELDKQFPGVRARYEARYGVGYECLSPQAQELWRELRVTAQALGISTRMEFFKPTPRAEQVSLFG